MVAYPFHPETRRTYKDLPVVPWELIARHEEQAQRNHGQTLARLAERGGLSPEEMLAVLQDRKYRYGVMMTTEGERAVIQELREHLAHLLVLARVDL